MLRHWTARPCRRASAEEIHFHPRKAPNPAPLTDLKAAGPHTPHPHSR